MTAVVKNRLNGGAICATPGISTPRAPSFLAGTSVSPSSASAACGHGAGSSSSGVSGAEEVQECGVEVVRVLPDAAVAARDRGATWRPGPARQLVRQRGGDEDVLLAGEHERRHGEGAEPVGRVVRLDDGELREVGRDRHRSMYRMPVSNSASSSSRVRKKSRVNAQSVTSRMTNGTPSTGAMSAHIANMREQKGPGAA